MRGFPLTCGETPWSPDGTSHSARQHSTQQQAQFAALHSLHSPAVSHARASLFLHPSNFFTPERIFFSIPAIPYAGANLLLCSRDSLRQSESSSLLQRFLTHFRNFFCLHCSWWSGWCRHPTPPLLLRYNLLIVLGFFFRMPSFLVSMATISPRCHHKDFLSDIFSPSSFPAGTQAVVTFPSGRNHHSWAKGYLEGVDNFGFGNLLGILLTLQTDSSSS